MKVNFASLLKLSALPLAFGLAGCHTTNSQSSPIPAMSSLVPAIPMRTTSTQDLPINESAKVCYATAEALEQGQKYAEAIALFEKARSLDSHLATTATRKLAALYDRNGDFDKALIEYRRGLKENPQDAELLNNLGYGYYCRAEWAEAEKNLRLAVAANPKLANAWINLGMTLAQQSRYDESLTAFSKVVTQAQAHCNLAWIQLGQNKIEDAKANYEGALRLEPGLQIARIGLQKMNQPNFTTRTTPGASSLANAEPVR